MKNTVNRNFYTAPLTALKIGVLFVILVLNAVLLACGHSNTPTPETPNSRTSTTEEGLTTSASPNVPINNVSRNQLIQIPDRNSKTSQHARAEFLAHEKIQKIPSWICNRYHQWAEYRLDDVYSLNSSRNSYQTKT